MASYQYTPPQAPQHPQPATMPNPHDFQQPQHFQHNEKAVYTQPTAQAPMQSGVNPLNVHQKVRRDLAARLTPQPLNKDGLRDWSSGICDCCTDGGFCILSYFCVRPRSANDC